jgi:flavin reductase (DIM6/NTAB) family NADH-FMN oxidoreductase RutF
VNFDAFTRICSTLDFPMAIVTAFDGHERSGCLVGFHTQCSIGPRRWLVCLSKTNHTYPIALRAPSLVVHFLRDDQHELAELFGGETGDAIGAGEKFDHCEWRENGDGAPIISGCDWISGPVFARHDAGDHTAHIIDIVAFGSEHARARQLGSRAVHDIRPGHEP